MNKLIDNSGDNNLKVIMDGSYHATRKHVNNEQNKEYKYPLIHSTPKSGIRYMYSNVNRGHFGISKVIFGEAGINHVIVDNEGKYGMTQGAMGIIITDKKEGENIKRALLSDKFDSVLKSCMWGNFRIDWTLFTYFKKDFWKEFIIDVEEKCEIIYSRNNYGSDKKWVSKERTGEFKYPCVHSTPKGGIIYYYSKTNDKGHFGVSKVIFGESGIYNAIIDMKGKYGMTQHSMGITVNNIEEAENIKRVLESEIFRKEVLDACSWSNFQIDWRLFTYFKKDFWKEFIHLFILQPI